MTSLLDKMTNLSKIKENIASSTDLTENYDGTYQEVINKGELLIFRNNKPELIVMDLKTYDEKEKLIKKFYELLAKDSENKNNILSKSNSMKSDNNKNDKKPII
ncbi:MAG: hypothetical protein ACLFMO_00790 [Eubacteriales bacterium]